MSHGPLLAALTVAAFAATPVVFTQTAASTTSLSQSTHTLESELDRIFTGPALAQGIVAVRIESLSDGRVWYERHGNTFVVPASTMKLVTAAVAAERLGWDFQFETRLETTGPIRDGILHGDVIVTGSGDPSIGSADGGHAPQFLEWADTLRQAGIRHVDGRIVGDDNAFDDEGLGAGWAWDYLSAGYAAPTGALSYNENVAVARISPGASIGAPAIVALTPPGHRLELTNETTTTAATTAAAPLTFFRLPGSAALRVRGSVAIGGAAIIRTVAVDNPTRTFVEALRLALAARGISVSQGAWDIDDLPRASPEPRRLVATRMSQPLSSLVGYAMKVSQNFYGETIFKTMGRTADQPGSAEAGRQAARDTLSAWGASHDAIVMADGSGLSRYDYLTVRTLSTVLLHVWKSDRLRGPFLAALPVGAHDGTLGGRMKSPLLDRRVQAKTGTITNVRALAGYADTASGEKLAFSIIVNNVTSATADVDRAVEQALEIVLSR